MTLESGKKLLNFRLTEKLGEGGMGVVWKAVDTSLDRSVAIKLLPEAFSHDAERMARFEREARLLASLNHPHIAAVYGLHEAEGRRFLSMELIPGEDLAERLDRGAIPLTDSLGLALQITEALEAAHEHGVIHRDLKPANIKLTGDGTVKVLDFGLAKALEEPAARGPDVSHSPTLTVAATQAGVILGTAAYMSPEQARGQEADRRADIWAFGVVLYEMLTGRKLFAGETVSDTLAAVLKTDPDWSFLPVAAPAGVRRLLRRCLVRDRRQRLQSMGDARLELQEAMTDPTGAADFEGAAVPAAPDAGALWRRMVPWVLAAGLAVTSAVLGTALLRDSTPPARTVRSAILPPPNTEFSLTGIQPGPPTLSPDGRRMAFAAIEEDSTVRLWVHDLAAGQARPLPGTENASYPFWAPDNRHLGFFAGARLKRIDTEGGLPVSLADAPYGKGGTWSEDGIILFAPHWNGPIHRVPAGGGEDVAVTEIVDGGEISGHRTPQFLPDGRHFIYLARTARIGANALRVASLDGSTDRLLLEGSERAVYAAGHLFFPRQASLMARPFDPASLEFTGEAFLVAGRVRIIPGASWTIVSATDDGTLVYMGARDESGSELIWFDGDGRPTGTIGERAGYDSLALSPDGKSVAVTINDVESGNVDVWVFDLDRGVPSRFTVDPAMDSDPVWSPDGESLYFRSTRDGGQALFLKKRHGDETPRRLLEPGNDAVLPFRVTPDGRLLLYAVSTAGGQSDLWTLPLDGSEEPSPFLASSFNEAFASFSPDGRWLAYASDESGGWEVYVTRFPDKGSKLRISTGGGLNPVWHPEGGKIVYETDNGSIMRVDVRPDGDSLTIGTPVLFVQQAINPGSGLGLAGEHVLAISDATEDDRSALTLVTGWRPEAGP